MRVVAGVVISKPDPSEYPPHYEKYISVVQGDDVLFSLGNQIDRTVPMLRGISEEDSLRRYAPGKWSLREIVGHLIDTERVSAYRALRFARNDLTNLSGFEPDDYVRSARFDGRSWADLVAEFELLRRGNLYMMRGFDKDAWMRQGPASNDEISVRALAYHMAGHELHHMRIIREKYFSPSRF